MQEEEIKLSAPQLIMQIDADVIDVKESMYFERCKRYIFI